MVAVVLVAAVCGIAGAIATHVTYEQSNLFILGDVTRRSRHVLWDPLAFDLLGLLWGTVAGVVAAKFFAASHPAKAWIAGLAATVLGIAIAGGIATFNRYQELYSHPNIAGPALVLEFELRLPVNLDPAGVVPDTVTLDEGSKQRAKGPLARDRMRVVDGRMIMPGSVPLKKIYEDRILSFPHEDNWHAIFTLLLHGTPTPREYEWTDWESERNSREDLPASQQYQIRYRVQRAAVN